MDVTENDLDKVFIGQCEIVQVDEYMSPKAGTTIKTAAVRSKIDTVKQTITLYGHIPERHGTGDISLMGDVGVNCKITERIRIEAGFTRAEFLWIRTIPPGKILENTEEVSDGKYILESLAEIDDIVYNATGEYVFPFRYHIRGRNRILRGFEITMPIATFNTYIQMRDIWYKDYTGSKKIDLPEDVV